LENSKSLQSIDKKKSSSHEAGCHSCDIPTLCG
jgi:hypothetical protein